MTNDYAGQEQFSSTPNATHSLGDFPNQEESETIEHIPPHILALIFEDENYADAGNDDDGDSNDDEKHSDPIIKSKSFCNWKENAEHVIFFILALISVILKDFCDFNFADTKTKESSKEKIKPLGLEGFMWILIIGANTFLIVGHIVELLVSSAIFSS